MILTYMRRKYSATLAGLLNQTYVAVDVQDTVSVAAGHIRLGGILAIFGGRSCNLDFALAHQPVLNLSLGCEWLVV